MSNVTLASSLPGKMFGKSFEVLLLTPHQVCEMLKVDRDVQRDLSKPHARKFRDYVLTGLLEPSQDIFIPAITATKRPDGTMSINDGQHRQDGLKDVIDHIETTIRQLASKLQKKDRLDASVAEGFEEKRSQYIRAQKRLNETRIPVLLFSGLDTDKERQLFHDLNNKGKKPPASLSLKYDNNDLYTYITKQAIEVVGEFKDVIEWGAKLTGSNKFLFSNLFQVTVKFVGKKKGVLTFDNYVEREKELISFFETFFANTPSASEDNILGISAVLQGVAMYANSVKAHAENGVDWIATIAKTFKEFDWSPKNPILLNVGKFTLTEDGKLATRGTGSTSTGVANALKAVTTYLDFNGNQTSIDQSASDESDESDSNDPQIDPTQIPGNESEAGAGEGASASGKSTSSRSKNSKKKETEATASTPASEPTADAESASASEPSSSEGTDPLDAEFDIKL